MARGGAERSPLLSAGWEERPGSGRENLRVQGRRSSIGRQQTNTQRRGRQGPSSVGAASGLLPRCPPRQPAARAGGQTPKEGLPETQGSAGFRGSPGQEGPSCVCPLPCLLERRRREAFLQPRPAGQKSSAGPAEHVGWAHGGGAVRGTGWPGRGCLSPCDRPGGFQGKWRPLGPDS